MKLKYNLLKPICLLVALALALPATPSTKVVADNMNWYIIIVHEHGHTGYRNVDGSEEICLNDKDYCEVSDETCVPQNAKFVDVYVHNPLDLELQLPGGTLPPTGLIITVVDTTATATLQLRAEESTADINLPDWQKGTPYPAPEIEGINWQEILRELQKAMGGDTGWSLATAKTGGGDVIATVEEETSYWIIPAFPVDFGRVNPNADNYPVDEATGGAPHIIDCRGLHAEAYEITVTSANAAPDNAPRMVNTEKSTEYLPYKIKKNAPFTDGTDTTGSVISTTQILAHASTDDAATAIPGTYDVLTQDYKTTPGKYTERKDIVALYFCIPSDIAAQTRRWTGIHSMSDTLTFTLTYDGANPNDEVLTLDPGLAADAGY